MGVAPEDVPADTGAMAAEVAVTGLLVSATVRSEDVDRGCQLTIVSSPITRRARRARNRASVDLARSLNDLIALAHRRHTLAL